MHDTAVGCRHHKLAIIFIPWVAVSWCTMLQLVSCVASDCAVAHFAKVAQPLMLGAHTAVHLASFRLDLSVKHAVDRVRL